MGLERLGRRGHIPQWALAMALGKVGKGAGKAGGRQTSEASDTDGRVDLPPWSFTNTAAPPATPIQAVTTAAPPATPIQAVTTAAPPATVIQAVTTAGPPATPIQVGSADGPREVAPESAAQEVQLTSGTATSEEHQIPAAIVVPGSFGPPSQYQPVMMPSAVPDSPRRAAERAAEKERVASRAMQDAVLRAQDEERAAMYASKKAASLRASAERAAAAEAAAAQSQIQAANSEQNAAVRAAAAKRQRAQISASRAVVQQAAAYQASADQQMSAQRAAYARTAAESARSGLQDTGMEDRDDGSSYGADYDDDGYDRESEGYRHDRDRVFHRRYHDASSDDIGHHHYDDRKDNSYERDGPSDHLDSCADFFCRAPLISRQQPERLKCDVFREGCTSDRCCLRAPSVCLNFICPAPMTLRLNPETLSCGQEECTAVRCCLQIAPPQMSGGTGCNVGDNVMAIWNGDGRQYPATITSVSPDSTISVNWQNGGTSYYVAAASQVFKAGTSCAGYPGEIPSGPVVPSGASQRYTG